MNRWDKCINRPKDWQPLTELDPTPGDPHEVHEESDRLKSTAKRLRDQARALKTVSEGEGLKGKYANDLQDKAADLEKRFREVASRYEKVQAPLAGWADELYDFQEESVKLLHKAQDHEQEGESKDKSTHGSGDKEEADSSGGSDQNGGQNEQLTSLINRYQERAEHYAGKIRAAVDDVVEDSAWESVSQFVDDTLNNKWVKLVFEAAGWIAMIVGVVALFCTPWGWLTALATYAVWAIAAKDVILLATGNGNWSDVAWDALALVTMHGGPAAAKGLSRVHLNTKISAGRSAYSKAESGVRGSSSVLKKANSVLRDPNATPRQRQAAHIFDRRISRQASEAGSKAERSELRSRPEVSRKENPESVLYGGDLDTTQKAVDITRMRTQYSDSSAVQKASSSAEMFKHLKTASWAGGVASGAIPKGLGESGLFPFKPYLPAYSEAREEANVEFSDGY